MPTKRRRFMVNIPPELEPLVIARAKALKRPVANYLEWLVTEDLENTMHPKIGHAAEDAQGSYGPAATIIGPRVLDSFVPKTPENPPATGSPRKPKPTHGAPR